MNESVLIQQQREILRSLHQVTDQHLRVTTVAYDKWQQLQRAYNEAQDLLAGLGEDEALTSIQHQTIPSSALRDVDPASAFQSCFAQALQSIGSLKTLLQGVPTGWRQMFYQEAHGKGILGSVGVVISLSPDSRLLASGGFDKTVKVWEVSSGHLLGSFKWHMPQIASLPPKFLSDGRLLMALREGKTVYIYEVRSGRLLQTLQGHKDLVTKTCFSFDGRLLASGSKDKTVKVWEVESGELLRNLQHDDSIEEISFVYSDSLLVSFEALKGVWKFWRIEDGHLLQVYKGQLLLVLPNSHVIVPAQKGVVEEREIENWRLVRTLSGYKHPVDRVARSPDGRLVALAKGNMVEVWDMVSGQLLYTRQLREQCKLIAISWDGSLMATKEGDKTVRIWETATGRPLQDLEHPEWITSIVFSQQGHLLATGGTKSVWVWKGSWPELPAHIAMIAQAMAETNLWYDRLKEQAAAEYRRTLQEQILAHHRHWLRDLERVMVTLHWSAPPWQTWTVGTETGQGVLRFGKIQAVLLDQGQLEMPALLAFPFKRLLLWKADWASRPTVISAIQSLLLRLLAALPPGKVRFTFIDPVGLGQNAAPFMHLADYDEKLVTSRAWSEPRHIEQRLEELTDHISTVVQTYLRNEYATIEDYNKHAGEIAEPYRVVVVFDFPANFNEDAARRLVSIVQNGPRCGVYPIILVDPQKPLPYGFNLADLERHATVIAWREKGWAWENDDFRGLRLELDTPPNAELFNRIVTAVGEAAVETGKVEVPFERIIPVPEQWWQADSSSGIQVPLGPIGARRVQHLDLGNGTAQHALVAGKTGSGKSTLLHVLITALALRYSPQEVQLYLVDFKKGVEFKMYATYGLPHARVVAIESEREFGLSVLQGLDAELKRRGDLFRAAGVDHIADYRRKTAQKMPRILLLVDEFQEFFSEDDPIASQAAQLLDRLVRQGRAFGIHVLLGSQTLAGSYTLARSTIDQMAVRIALQCSEADSRLILADDNPAARLLSRPGEAIYNDANGLVEGNHPFQVAWLSDEERDAYLQRIRDFAQKKEYSPLQPQIVFEGNAPAHLEENPLLEDLLRAPGWPSPARGVDAWLGEPVAIAHPTAARFRRQSASNLLIVGRQDEEAAGMLLAALVSLAAQHEPERARFYFLDFGSVDAPYADVWTRLAETFPHPFRYGRRRQLEEIITEISGEVNRRIEDEAEAAQRAAVFLTMFGLQGARDLRPEDEVGFSSFGLEEERKPNLPQQFASILQEGPDVGVHTLIWCDSYTNLMRSLDRRSLREFEMRVIFQMSAEDSANLIDTPAASKLGPYRAFFYSEDEGRLEKFRPYGLPSLEWLGQVKERLGAKR